MLKQRIITALILAPLTLWAIFTLSTPLFALMFAVVFALAAWEWSRLVGYQVTGRVLYLVALMLLSAGTFLCLGFMPFAVLLALAALLWWTVALVAVLRYPNGSGVWRDSHGARAVAGVLVLLPAWAALVLLHREAGPGYVILLMLLVWGADTGAYFAGRRFGKHKLAPRVSPGKSWEGVYGALLMTLLLALVGYYWLSPSVSAGTFVLLCLLSVSISVLGDLNESMFKRIVDIKDSGGLLPGHGGVMDRIDSLTAAAPLYAVGVLWGLQ